MAKDLEASCPSAIQIIMAAYNEELFLNQSLQAIFESDCADRIYLYIGSDGSKDNTNAIIQSFELKYPSQVFYSQYERSGKANVLNSLVQKYQLGQKESTLIFLDANIIVAPDCFSKILAKLWQSKSVGMVGASVATSLSEENTEVLYIEKENTIKDLESKKFGYTIGVFGACFAIKNHLYTPIPSNIITDDLFQTFSIIRKGYYVLYDNEAKVYESILADISNEYERKKRYGAGNFQVLNHFLDLLNPSKTSWGFVYCFLFHKIIRWLLPIGAFLIWIISVCLLNYSPHFFVISIIGFLIISFLGVNYWLLRNNKQTLGHSLFYFLTMNVALLIGFINYLKGINNNVWNRSKRN